MQHLLDTLASGIHDAKNQLFVAESLVAASEAQNGIDLGEARYAIEAASARLTRMLAAYRLMRRGAQLAIVPAIVGDLCAEVALAQQHHLAAAGIELRVDCQMRDEWPLDRDLVGDMLNNAVQNAGRFARRTVAFSAQADDGGLLLRVEDDGPGFASLPPPMNTGLLVAQRLAALHQRRGRSGNLRLDNASTLGGARFELWLP
jgi:signal transduction histidine kinase